MLGLITVRPYLTKMDNNGLENGVNRHCGMVVMDLEYTSWEGSLGRGWSKPGEAREIIQIGAVKIGKYRGGWSVNGVFEVYVRPTMNPVLSLFIQDLTGISNTKISTEGVQFSEAVERLRGFVCERELILVNGDDAIVFDENCLINRLKNPFPAESFINIRPTLANAIGADISSVTLNSHRLGRGKSDRSSNRRQHNAVDDALCICDALIDLQLCDQFCHEVRR